MNTKDFLRLGVPVGEPDRRGNTIAGQRDRFAIIAQVMAAQTDMVDVLGRFDPKLVKMYSAGERAEA